MKIRGMEIKDYKTSFLLRVLKQNQFSMKLYPWCIAFAFAIGFGGLLYGLTEGDGEPIFLFVPLVMIVSGLLCIWSYKHTKKIDQEIEEVLESRNLSDDELARIEEYNQKQAKELKKSIVFGVITVAIIAIFMLGIQNCNCAGDSKYEDVFNKDPNTWTEDEEDYVNNLFDYIVENDDNK